MQRYRVTAWLAALCLATACTTPFAAEQTVTPQPVGIVDPALAEKSIDLTLPDPTARSVGDTVTGAAWLRLKLVVSASQPLNAVSVTIRDALGSPVESIDLSGKSSATIWSKLFSSSEYLVTIEGPPQPNGTVRVAAVARAKESPEPLSIIEPDAREEIAKVTDPRVRKAARGVVKIFYQDGDVTRSCSGFLIGRQRIVTNHHCFHSQDVCDTAVAAIDYLGDGTAPPTQQSKCVKFLGADGDLDISVLDFDANNIPASIEPLRLAGKSPLPEQQVLQIIQFPSNEPKKISACDCLAVVNPVDGYAKDSDFTHRCDTVLGASGSPVLDHNFQVVGLHHLGINGVPLNRAVRIEPIQDWLQSKGLLGQ